MASYYDLLEACLAVFRLEEDIDAPGEAEALYQPRPFAGIRIETALAHMRRLLADQATPAAARQEPLIARSAVASSLFASLELARHAELRLDQKFSFGTIVVQKYPE